MGGIVTGEKPAAQRKIDMPMVAVAQSTSGGSYLMFTVGGNQTYAAIWVPTVACTLYAISASWINTANSSNTVYFCMYRNGAQYGATPTKTMTTTWQTAYLLTTATAINVQDQIEVACFPSGAPGGTLTSQVHLHVVY